MATGNRPDFLRQAIRGFLRQSYTPRELIIMDDSPSPLPGPWPDGVHYRHLTRATPTGAKLNLAAEAARGPILQKMDDDDYYGPGFLRLAVDHLPHGDLALWDCFLALIAGEAELRYSGHGWKAGGTFCFRRDLWRRRPFREVQRDEDYWFLADHQPALAPVCAPEQYLLVRHGRNTWTRMSDGTPADDYLRSLPPCGRPLAEVADAEACRFYRRRLAFGRATSPSRDSRSVRPT